MQEHLDRRCERHLPNLSDLLGFQKTSRTVTVEQRRVKDTVHRCRLKEGFTSAGVVIRFDLYTAFWQGVEIQLILLDPRRRQCLAKRSEGA